MWSSSRRKDIIGVKVCDKAGNEVTPSVPRGVIIGLFGYFG
jgi:hypothetical protein